MRLPLNALDALRRRDWAALKAYDDLLMIDWKRAIQREYIVFTEAPDVAPTKASAMADQAEASSQTVPGADAAPSPKHARRKSRPRSKKEAPPGSLVGIVETGAANGQSPHAALGDAGLIGKL